VVILLKFTGNCPVTPVETVQPIAGVINQLIYTLESHPNDPTEEAARLVF
jgi:hypothetical protein